MLPEKKAAPLEDLYGLFFEDLNHAADGGLYAEMVQNRSFEFEAIDHPSYHSLYGWENEYGEPLVQEKLTLRVLSDAPLHANNPNYLKIDATEAFTIQNAGFNEGMYFEKGKHFRFSLFARNSMQPTTLTVTLKTNDGQIVAQDNLIITAEEWKAYDVELTATLTTAKGRLAISFLPEANVALDMISLFPEDTFMGRKNGCRKDIAEKLAAMKPKFMRFPGGCLVHDGSLNASDRDSMYRWKNTIGSVEQRPSRRNSWGYNQSLGLGFFEYFQLCEDLGAKPIPVLPGGVDPHHQRMVPLDKLDEWVQDALDLIEFANGPVDSTWGQIRAEMGHPEPFYLEYLAIGNEEVGQPFFDRYPFFHQAIKERYPEIKLINSAGPFAAGSEYERGWQSAKEWGSDLVDEHYYQTTDWLLANHYRYDAYDSNGPKVFLGEYASWGNEWYNAVVEASYMIGLERNADKVALACYAPMLANVDYVNWRPDLIWFDQANVYGSMNYYVQQLFMHYQGTHNIAWKAEYFPEPEVMGEPIIRGKIGVAGDMATISYRHFTVIDHVNNEIKEVADDTISDRDLKVLTEIDSNHYTIRFDFEKTGGQWDRGFQLKFGMEDEANHFAWLLGGWQNQDSIIRATKNQRVSDLTQTIWGVKTGKTYHCELTVRNRHVTAVIDGVTFNEVEAKLPVKEPLYINAVYDAESDKQILKLVNVTETDRCVELADVTSAQINTLAADKTAVNSLEQPENLTKESVSVTSDTSGLVVELPRYSVTFVIV